MNQNSIKSLPALTDENYEQIFNVYQDENGNYLKEYPQYTRPAEYNGWEVPSILQSGDHKKIADWRKNQQTDI